MVEPQKAPRDHRVVPLSPDTLIPLSFIGIVVGVVYFMTQIQATSVHNAQRIDKLEQEQFEIKQIIFDRLQDIELQNQAMNRSIGELSGKLDIMVEIKRGSKDRR